MEFPKYSQGVAEFGGELAYDLRQIYAKIVGEHLEDITQARKADNYSVYYKTLKDLFIVVRHKFKDKKVKVLDPITNKEIEKSEMDVYNDLINNIVLLATKYPQTFLGKNKDPDACAKLERALNAIEMFLYQRIEDAKMFGGSQHTPGL